MTSETKAIVATGIGIGMLIFGGFTMIESWIANVEADSPHGRHRLGARIDRLDARLRTIERGFARVDQRLETLERAVVPPAAPRR